MTAAIRLEGVGKEYRLTNDGGLLVKRMMRLGRTRFSRIWALKDVSFEVEQGGTLGVIGRNGSGKTTLLQVLAGITAPTTGRVRVEGTIAPLIGVGVGFNPELTGRENVFANGQILGMSKQRIERELDEIVAFSELEAFLDVPVKFYSSGMFLRLAFAVAIQVRPEVLLVDEVLAVGDLGFQSKCMDRMAELKAAGATIVVVTHSMPTLHRMCDRTIVLSKGDTFFDGPTEEAISVYYQVMEMEGPERNEAGIVKEGPGGTHAIMGGARLRCEVVDVDGKPTRQTTAGEPINLDVEVEFDREVRNPVLGVSLALEGLGSVYMAHLQPADYLGHHGPGRPLAAKVALTNHLLAGAYDATVVVFDESGQHELGRVTTPSFAVTTRSEARGIVDLEARFQISGLEHTPRLLRLAGRPPDAAGPGGALEE